jgi:hypothetical protein
MIDGIQRAVLAGYLTRLLNGEITTDEFADSYVTNDWDRSTDRGIPAVAEFALDLCDLESMCGSRRLIGEETLPEETRSIGNRCCSFLRSNREYEWPDQPAEAFEGCLVGPALFLGIPLAIALGLITVAMLLQRDWSWSASIGFPTVLAAIVATATLWSWSKRSRSAWDNWKSAGAFDVWPYFRVEDCADPSPRGPTDFHSAN